jgi:hypothetical protein
MTQLPPEYITPYIASNMFSILLSVVAALSPQVCRWVFVAIFLGAGIFNAFMAIRQPSMYVEVYGPLAVLELYSSFIYGLFSEYATAILLVIAAGQLVVGTLLLVRRRGRLFGVGALGGIIFLVAIAPLGVGSAFPATLIMAAALFVTWYRWLQTYRRRMFGRRPLGG